MSGTATLSGGVSPANHSDASGAATSFNSYYGLGSTYESLTASGSDSVSGPLVIGQSNLAVTVSGASAIDDATATGSNSISVDTPSVVFASQNDTISAASAATTLFGAATGTTTFALGGQNSSATGGSGSFSGMSSGANSTLVGGTGVSLMTMTGANSLGVAGQAGTTGIDASASSGPLTIATNPLGNTGTLVAILGSGADTVVGGSGASTVTAGTGSDVFTFIKGHGGGTEYIIGFNAKDNLAFAGYGYSATNLPTETVTSLGDTITLNDGTQITLAGIDHKIF
ncbi:hypothetical protein [Acidisoma sp. 7E03]